MTLMFHFLLKVIAFEGVECIITLGYFLFSYMICYRFLIIYYWNLFCTN
jgi:hypothetical protein